MTVKMHVIQIQMPVCTLLRCCARTILIIFHFIRTIHGGWGGESDIFDVLGIFTQKESTVSQLT